MASSEVKQLEERVALLQQELRRTQKELSHLKNASGEERKHWEANSTSREQMEFLLSHLPVVFWGIDREGRIMQFQGAGLDRLGLGGGEAYGKSLNAVLGDDPALIWAVRRALAGETLRQQVPLEGHALDCYLEPQWNAEGDVVGVRGTAMVLEVESAQSPTPQKQTGPFADPALDEWESPLFEWLKTFRDFVLTVDRKGTIRFINRVMPPLTMDEVVGASIYDFFDEERGKEIQDYLEEAFATGKNVDYEIESVDPNGVLRTYECRLGPFKASGEAALAVVIARDVTELRRAEEEIRIRQAELEHLSRFATMGEMAAIMAHYLNNPLAAIANYAHGCIRRLRANDVDVDQLMDAQQEIVQQCNRSSDYIRHLRGFLQKREAHYVEIDMTDILIDAARLTEPEFRAENLAVRFENEASKSTILVDPLQIEQVLVNLLLNAVDAMKPFEHENPLEVSDARSPREVVVRVESGKAGEIVVSVIDTGRGLSSGFEERIFEPFFTTQEKRLGMGLSVSRSIVESHGGRLEGRPNAGPGATFRFNLPRCTAGNLHE